MLIIVNAEPHDIVGPTLEAALGELGISRPEIATALNGLFVPRDARGCTELSDGDRLEVLAPMQGG